MRNYNTKLGSLFLASLLSLGSFGSAYASGFALIEVNATGQGNAYAGAAVHTNNASTIFFNPAGMMSLDGEQLVLAAHFIEPSSDFQNDGSTLAPSLLSLPISGEDDDGGQGAFVPNFYWVKPLDDNMSFGLGVNSPFGLRTEYDEEWVGRYHGIISDLKTVNFNPSIGYRVNDKISVGAGVNLMLAQVELTSAVDLGAVCYGLPEADPINGPAAALACLGTGVAPSNPFTDADADLDGDNFDDIALGFNFGLTYMVSSRTRIGVAYRSEVDIEVDGDADFTVPVRDTPLDPADPNPVGTGVVGGVVIPGTGLFADSGLGAEVSLPASFSFSLAHQVDKITWLFDVTWTGWSSFDELRIDYDNPVQPDTVTTEDWDDSFRYSVGLDYQYSDRMILRAGLALDESPVPSPELRTVRLPGDERTWVSLGLSYMIDNSLSIDVGYSHLFLEDTEIDNEFESGLSTVRATIEGEYEAEVDILSAQLNWYLD